MYMSDYSKKYLWLSVRQILVTQLTMDTHILGSKRARSLLYAVETDVSVACHFRIVVIVVVVVVVSCARETRVSLSSLYLLLMNILRILSRLDVDGVH